MQRRLRNVQESVMHVQSFFFSNINLLLFCRSRCRRRHTSTGLGEWGRPKRGDAHISLTLLALFFFDCEICCLRELPLSSLSSYASRTIPAIFPGSHPPVVHLSAPAVSDVYTLRRREFQSLELVSLPTVVHYVRRFIIRTDHGYWYTTLLCGSDEATRY